MFDRLATSLRTPPSRAHFRLFLGETLWLVPLLLLLGAVGGLMHWRPLFDVTILKLAMVAIVVPALGEELLFRAALLPRPRPNAPLPRTAVALSALVFVAWHPLQIFVFGPDWGRTVLDPWFLAAAAALGIACARLYWRTGSLWPSVGLHWLVVVGWKALLSGPSPWQAA